MDRKGFIKTSLAGAAALAGMAVIPGCASSDDKSRKASSLSLKLSFQEGTAPG